MPHLLNCAPVVQIFWPLIVQLSPFFTADMRSPARSEPAAGSLKSWHQISSPRAIFSRCLDFCSGVPWAMMVGPSMPMPMPNTFGGTWYLPSSWFQITDWIAVASRPPNSFGQVRQAQPLSFLQACHSLADLIVAGSSRSPSIELASPCASGLRCLERNARAAARNSASCGVSLKSIVNLLARPQAC